MQVCARGATTRAKLAGGVALRRRWLRAVHPPSIGTSRWRSGSRAASGDARNARLGRVQVCAALQKSLQPLGELSHTIRLEDHVELLDVLVGFDIARGEQDLDPRPVHLDAPREIGPAGRARHFHIAEHEIDPAVVAKDGYPLV